MIVSSRFRSYSVDYNASFPSFLFDYVNAYNNKIALLDLDTNSSLTFGQLRKKVEDCTRRLVALGVCKGDVIAALCGNSMEFLVLSLAVCHVGAAFAPLNPAYKQDEIVKYTNQLSAKWIFTENVYIDKIGTFREQIICAADIIGLDNFFNSAAYPVERAEFVQDISDTAMIFFSSGTTGLPKGVCLSHRSLIAHVHLTSSINSDPSTPMPHIASEDRVYGVLPYFHAGGLLTVYCMLSQGATVYVNKIFHEEKFFNVIQQHEISVINVVPPILSLLATQVKKLGSLRLVLVGASQVNLDIVTKLRNSLPDVTVTELYGLTEVGILTLMSPLRSKPHTTGVLMPGVACKIVDGELSFRSATAMSGYLDPEQTSETIASDGWIRSGDLGSVDEDGYFSITGRLKELIKVRCWQVAPKELEDVLSSSFPDQVCECCVIGVPDERAGELPKAFVVLKTNALLTEQQIQSVMNQKLISFKQLKGGVQFVDSIPKNPSGKVDRRRLAKEHNEPTNAGRSA